MLLDFCFWGTGEISGWSIGSLPCDALANLWCELSQRKQKEINALNYSSALLAGAKYSQPGAKVKVMDWLPYNTDEAQEKQQSLDQSLQNEIWLMDLPPAMMRDLVKAKLITPRE